jgi:DNA-directed RNA polymerase subunit H (RpoH/RPB5)
MSLNIELNTKEINTLICENVIKMIWRRKLIDDWTLTFEEIYTDINNKAFIDFKLNNDTKCSIYIINTKLSSIVQGTPLDEYLSNNLNIHKIIIIKEPSKKVVKQIINEYKNTEFFFEYEMVEDIGIKVCIPKHILLNEDEKNELSTKFNLTELSIILSTDMMSRYYNANIGDVFRIIRPSITSGTSIFYRRVISGSIDLIF